MPPSRAIFRTLCQALRGAIRGALHGALHGVNRSTTAAAAVVLTAALGGAACSPTFDWREVRADASGMQALLPCRPSPQTRRVRLAQAEVALTLVACRAGDVTWALAYADMEDPARVAAALAALREAAQKNFGGAGASRAPTPPPLKVPGATPNPGAGRFAVDGSLPDGQPVHAQYAVFTRGTWVFQATCVGAALPAEAVETFFDGLRAPT
ncbi:MAG: hypothetical protein ABI696_06925 [Rubrivivax sp.]